jgi:hypothetical protein
MANGNGNEWLVGLAKWGFTPTFTPDFSERMDRELKNQKTKSAYKDIANEFPGKNLADIREELLRERQVAFDVLKATNDRLYQASLQLPEGTELSHFAKELHAEVAANDAKYEEIKRKLDVVEQMEDIQGRDKWDDRERRVFFDKMQEHLDTLNTAAAESAEIGGADVKLTFENAKLLANEGKWPKAAEWLDKAIEKAKLVNLRKPYLTAKLAHEPKIKAASNIKKVNEATQNKYGEEVETEWKAILKVAESGAYDAAAGRIVELTRRIERDINPALQGAREENATQLGNLREQLERAKGDPGALRDIATEIFRNTGEAEDLGVDTGENARKKFTEDEGSAWTAANCEKTFAAYDWFALKQCRKERKIKLNGVEGSFSDDDMWKLVQYRGKVVNELIDQLRQAYPTLIASASGSEDIESDIDIAFATPTSGDDVKAAKEFNKVISSRFGKPPGRVFDVNIYPRDYRALRGDSFKPGYSVDENKDHGIDEPDEGASMKLSKIDQDVATLLKQRRFLDETAFNQMLKTLLDQAPEDTKKRIETQYEEGEDIYLLTSLEKVEKIRQNVDLATPLTDPRAEKHRVALAKHIEDLDKINQQGGKENLALAQKLIPKILDLFEEVYPDETMDVTDALYLDKMGALREEQDTIRMLKEEKDPLTHHPEKTCLEAHDGKEHADWLKETINAREVKVKKDMFTNIIFANEAIMSQGALNHVVGALQAKTPEAQRQALDELTAADLMQSVNEQVADLFKEMKHYDGVVEEAAEDATGEGEKESAKRRATGEGYVHASKYLSRLLDAAVLLNMKYPGEESVQAPYDAIENTVGTDLRALKQRVDDVLLKLRKSAVIPPDVKGEVGALDMQELFLQVKDIGSFRTMIEAFAIELNKRIRSLGEFKNSQKMEAEEERKAEKAYFETAGANR